MMHLVLDSVLYVFILIPFVLMLLCNATFTKISLFKTLLKTIHITVGEQLVIS